MNTSELVSFALGIYHNGPPTYNHRQTESVGDQTVSCTRLDWWLQVGFSQMRNKVWQRQKWMTARVNHWGSRQSGEGGRPLWPMPSSTPSAAGDYPANLATVAWCTAMVLAIDRQL